MHLVDVELRRLIRSCFFTVVRIHGVFQFKVLKWIRLSSVFSGHWWNINILGRLIWRSRLNIVLLSASRGLVPSLMVLWVVIAKATSHLL